MDSGIDSTENSNGSSSESFSVNLIEVPSDSSLTSEDTSNPQDQYFFRPPPNIEISKTQKENDNTKSSKMFLNSQTKNSGIFTDNIQNNAPADTITEPVVPANSPVNDSDEPNTSQEHPVRSLKIPRIDITSYDAEPFPKPLMPFPEGTCLKLHFPKYVSELGSVMEEATPNQAERSPSAVASGPIEVLETPNPYGGSMALMPYESRDLQRKFRYYRRRIREIISTRPKEKRLRTAAGLNNVDLVEQLLNDGVDSKATDERRRTALHIAASKGYTKIVKLLLQHGANPNQKDSVGNTPLHLAACTSHIETVTLLLKAGTDVKQADNQGYSPLHLASCRLKFLQKDPNPSSFNLRLQVCQIVEMMQEYLNRSGQTEEAELLTALTSKLTLTEPTSSESGSDIKQLLNSLQDLTLNKASSLKDPESRKIFCS